MADSLNVPEQTEAEPASEMLTSSCYGYECFQNYTAPEVFIQGLAGTVSTEDTEAIIRAQKVMLQRFEKTNAMLTNCNALSAQRLQNTTVDFKRHVQMLTEMKKDLSQVFERIRKLKTKLTNQYPKQFAEAANRTALAEEEEEPSAAAADGGADGATGGVRRRERPGRQSRAQQQLKRHSCHASVAQSSSGSGAGERPVQVSEPPPHSSSDSEAEEEVSVSSTNS
ncbi:KxDL motif-containing protein [Amphibalanus amphitrite]|uniref:KxDL motif-containing protein n=1 Tax=Amphibalanus amphitrite TaxID=1232801 RepID=A0A6A4VII7_AMPAM|nr:KxDL motif-containing protein [Amphibalanus amphitrite]